VAKSHHHNISEQTKRNTPRRRPYTPTGLGGGSLSGLLPDVRNRRTRMPVERTSPSTRHGETTDVPLGDGEITWSVQGGLNVNAVVLADADLPYWTSKIEHIAAFTAIFSNICTAHAQKRLFLNIRCKFRHRRSIRRPRFAVRVQNFGDLATFSVDFCIIYSECPPYFYFRFVWPTDLESIPNASTLTLIIPTKFEVDMTIHCRVKAFLSADTSRDLLTLTFDLLTLSSCHTRRITWPTLTPSLTTLRLFVRELRVVTFPVGYRWKCVRGHFVTRE